MGSGGSGGPDDGTVAEGGDEQNDGGGNDAANHADSAPDAITCMPPMVYGGSSGSGQTSIAWEETCSNGHTYQAFCQYPYCECSCTDEGPDGDTFGNVTECGGYGFAACGYPCEQDSGGCMVSGPTMPDGAP
jgi:hypothetical protein